MADLEPGPGLYQSSRAKFDVLIGEDPPSLSSRQSPRATILHYELYSRNHSGPRSLEKSHCIYMEDRPSINESDMRQVSAMSMLNLERAIIKAAVNGHAAAVATLLSFASEQGLEPTSVITRWAVDNAIINGHAAAFDALAAADPTVVNFPVGHGTVPLDRAVKWAKPK